VVDKNDDPIINLPIDVFSIYENGVDKPIKNLTHPITTPISVGILLDYSGSITPEAQLAIETAAKNFIDLLMPTDEAAIVKFAQTIETLQPFTTDKDALKAAIDTPYPSSPNCTVLYDSTVAVVNDAALRPTDRQAIILFSDMRDEGCSSNTLSEAMAIANQKGIPIFTLGFSGLGGLDLSVMDQMAQETGGKSFASPTSAEIQQIFSAISQILSNQYLIEYDSSSNSGSPVSIDVIIDNNGEQGEDAIDTTGC